MAVLCRYFTVLFRGELLQLHWHFQSSECRRTLLIRSCHSACLRSTCRWWRRCAGVPIRRTTIW
jgi:hypothetical protein